MGLAKTAGAVSKTIIRLINVAESGIGALSQPFLVVLRAHGDGKAKLVREAYEHRLKLLREKNRAELKAAKEIGKPPALPAARTPPAEIEIEVLLEDDPVEDVAIMVMQTEQAVKRRGNLLTIVGEAADSLPDEVSDDPVHPDWTARFFTAAQDVSDQDLQKLWGRLLAGEVTKPGSVPLRTIELLRNLTKREALLFIRLLSYAIAPDPKNPDEFPCFVGAGVGLTGEEMLLLEDAGLLDPISRNLPWYRDETASLAPSRRFLPNTPVKLKLEYGTGHTTIVRSEDPIRTVTVTFPKMAALPLIKVIGLPSVDLALVTAVAAAFDAQQHMKATLYGPGECPTEEWVFLDDNKTTPAGSVGPQSG